MSKLERIEKERERLAATLTNMDENQKQTAAGLISSAAFLRVTLEDLEAEINAAGCVEVYTNGRDQSGIKVSAACQAYASLNTKYQSTIQKLLKITPPAPKPMEERAPDPAAEARAAAEIQANKIKMDQQRSHDFFKALRDGTTTQEKYKEFCAAWDLEHADE